MTDVLLFQTPDDGEINVTGGVTELTGGFETAAYLSLFGGNFGDNGLDPAKTWWGNISEPEPDKKYISETQNILTGLPASAGNLQRLNEAVERDLAWFIDRKIASDIEIETIIPAKNRVTITVSIEARGNILEFEFTQNWKAMT